jgi:transcriptional regulator with XRE-family HTH domain
VGRRLRELREERGLTQETLAAKAGVHRTFVGKVERGETAVTVDSVATLCSTLGVTLDEFFSPLSEPFDLKGPRRQADR